MYFVQCVEVDFDEYWYDYYLDQQFDWQIDLCVCYLVDCLEWVGQCLIECNVCNDVQCYLDVQVVFEEIDVGFCDCVVGWCDVGCIYWMRVGFEVVGGCVFLCVVWCVISVVKF